MTPDGGSDRPVALDRRTAAGTDLRGYQFIGVTTLHLVIHSHRLWFHGCSRQGNSARRESFPRLCGARKGPAADGARFLPSTQIWSAEGSLSFRLPRQFRLRGVVPSPHGQKVTHRQGPLPAGAASSQGFSSESVSLDENLAIARTETTLRGWACRWGIGAGPAVSGPLGGCASD
jgi:hypothetical protein